ncbi:hypothetical protein AWV80_01365 [Cupriavidus sp. UYMU48A]|nr:hypothetical protein AWV80_01365 [Cupriavidus sp. UYMU48A]
MGLAQFAVARQGVLPFEILLEQGFSRAGADHVAIQLIGAADRIIADGGNCFGVARGADSRNAHLPSASL